MPEGVFRAACEGVGDFPFDNCRCGQDSNSRFALRVSQRYVAGLRDSGRAVHALSLPAVDEIEGGAVMLTNAVRPNRRLQQAIYNIGAFIVPTLGALPAIWIIFTAMRPASEVNTTPPIWIPQRITFDAFESLFGLNPQYAAGVPVGDYTRNSILVATMSTVVVLALVTMGGYAFHASSSKVTGSSS